MPSQAMFRILEPIEWDDISLQSPDFTDLLDDILFHGRSIIASLPSSAAPPSSQAPLRPDHRPLENHVQLMVEGLRREWKEVKGAGGKDDPLAIDVYRLPAADNKGTWFGRRSVHTALPFDRWKHAFAAEFPEALRTGHPVRGLSAQERLEDMATDSCHVQVLRMGAQFPGPTAPRDFVAMVMTCESSIPPAAAEDASTRPLRELVVVSKPCEHPDSPPVHGTIRGFYESVEMIREIPAADGQVAVEWAMVTRSNPGGNVPRFMIERGTPSAICGDALKFYQWMEAADLTAYEKTDTKPHAAETPESASSASTGVAAAEHDSRHAVHSLHPQNQPGHHHHHHSHLGSPLGSPRHSIRSMRSIADTLDSPVPTSGIGLGSSLANDHCLYDSDSDDDNASFISALSEPEHTSHAPPSPRFPPSPRYPPSRHLNTPGRRSTDEAAAASAPNGFLSPSFQPHRASQTFPMMKMHGGDGASTPPRLSAEWMASTEEIAAVVAHAHHHHAFRNAAAASPTSPASREPASPQTKDRHHHLLLHMRRHSAHKYPASLQQSPSQRRPRRATTPSASSTQLDSSLAPERQYAASASNASTSSMASRTSSSGSQSRPRLGSKSSATPSKKEHRSLADRLLHRTPSKSKAARKEAERQRKQEAKERRAAEKREEREMKQGVRTRHHEEKHEARMARRAAAKAQKDASPQRGASSSDGSLRKDGENYGTAPAGTAQSGKASGSDSVPRSVAGALGSAASISTAAAAPTLVREDPRMLKYERDQAQAQMDTLKQQVARLRNQNALLAGRLGQLGLEDEEIQRLATYVPKSQ
ncbi:hypothetical protein BROUX41_004097 [Berkeleyomyces rouxiae]|uniref:uncharacterized protein n=1 Tax=Berkeleyomyces rouxiae TaxID=2035830 RepID=UPI003B78CB67